MSIWLTNLAEVLRNAGLPVQELINWKTAAFPSWGGFEEPPSHIMCHHTASNPSTDPSGDLNYITVTHPLKPICNLYLSRSGTFYVVAAGQVCTNGAGSSKPWNGGVPDDTMNLHAISIEAANNGIGERWSDAQIHSYVHGVAALCKAYNIPNSHVRAHFEWAPSRKIDPAGQSPYATGSFKWDMNKFRADVAAVNSVTPPSKEHEVEPLDPPYRTDTRDPGGVPLSAGEIRRLAVMMGGKTVMINFTVVPLNDRAGVLTAFNDIHATPPKTSNVNWDHGDITANTSLVPTNGGWIKVVASQPCHLVTDTQGYTV
jgi:N-acetylmuramoyl-L-alanine amidase